MTNFAWGLIERVPSVNAGSDKIYGFQDVYFYDCLSFEHYTFLTCALNYQNLTPTKKLCLTS